MDMWKKRKVINFDKKKCVVWAIKMEKILKNFVNEATMQLPYLDHDMVLMYHAWDAAK